MSDRSPSLVSVIMPVYNGEAYIGAAIESVLAQSYAPIKLIVVNDGSTDNTKKIVSSFEQEIIYLQKEHSGIGATLNLGVSQTRGDYIAFLDADDLWLENKLELQVRAFNNPQVEIVFAFVQQFISDELAREEKARIQCPKEPMPGYVKSAMLTKKETFFKVGFFSEQYQMGDFIDWYLRAQALGLEAHLLPEVLVKRRLHTKNSTGQDDRLKMDYIRVLKTGLDRRRGKQS